MPLIDLPLEELHQYAGRNPRPADHDAYWEAALAEMRAVDPELKLEPVPFPAEHCECFHLTFNGVAGARIYAKLVRPKAQSKPGPAIVKFHGYSMNSGEWLELSAYAACGFTIAAMDVRGQGGRSTDPGGVRGNTLNGHIIRGLEDAPEKLFYRNAFLDTAQLAGLVMAMDNVDETRVGAFGWSQGGGLTYACAALEPRIARAAPVYPFLSDFKRVWEMDLAKSAYDEIQTWFRRFDPNHLREAWVWERLGYIDVQHLAPRIRARILMVTGLMDPICPPSTQFAIYNKVSAPKDLLLYPDFGHEHLPEANDHIFQFFAELL
jgi:cephalosporin-C deacetylase